MYSIAALAFITYFSAIDLMGIRFFAQPMKIVRNNRDPCIAIQLTNNQLVERH
jgi:hypothetical protein